MKGRLSVQPNNYFGSEVRKNSYIAPAPGLHLSGNSGGLLPNLNSNSRNLPNHGRANTMMGTYDPPSNNHSPTRNNLMNKNES